MAENKGDQNVTLKHLEELARQTDQRLDDLELGRAGKVTGVSISIPPSAWVDNTDPETLAAGYEHIADIAVDGLTDSNVLDTVLDVSSQMPARSCGMAATATPGTGTIRYYAVRKSDIALTATVRMFVPRYSGKEG